MKYETLLNVGVEVTQNEYRSLVLNFIPEYLAAHLANVSAAMKAQNIVSPTSPNTTNKSPSLDAEILMQFAIDEWDRRAPARKAKEKQKESQSGGTALATVSSEKPGAKTGGGDKRKRFGKRGECWNCGDKGHKRDTCPKPKQESNSSSEGKSQQNSNSSKGKGNSSGSKNATGSPSKDTSANAAIDEDDVDGAWAIIGSSFENTRDLYEFLTDMDEEGMPDLKTVTRSDNEKNSGVVKLNGNHCKNEAESPNDNNHGPSAGVPTIDTSGRLWSHEVEAYVAKTGGRSEIAWDLYDSGASHHMSPKREDFINYVEIPEKPLTAANKEIFSAVGMGDMIVSIPNGDKEAKIKLTRVLYMPALGFTLISIGRIDEAGHYSTFGGGKCEIQTGERKTIGTVPKSGGVYRVPHGSHVATAAIGIKHMTLFDLHCRLGHISLRAVKDLIRHGIVDGIILTDASKDFECQPCILAKMTKTSVPKIRQGERAKEFAEEIHMTFGGPLQPPHLGDGATTSVLLMTGVGGRQSVS